MTTSTLITYGENGAQFFYDAITGIVFSAGLGKAAIVVFLIIGVLTMAVTAIGWIIPKGRVTWKR